MTSRPASPASSAAPPSRYRLAGPSCRPDPRTHAYRGDVADIRLADRLFAPHYARAELCAAQVGTMMRASPSPEATAVSQLLPGEEFELLDRTGGWAWGRSAHDGYVGYVSAAALGSAVSSDHRIAASAAPVFGRPDIKSPVLATLPIGARVTGECVDAFLQMEEGFVHRRHIVPLAASTEPVAVAERLIGLPYLWGGRGEGGIDCSGLIQVALSFAGIAAPRDSDQQRALGQALDDGAPFRRGDLVFFPGHVGLMTNPTDLIHANAYWMAVTVEPLADVIARLSPDHAEPVLARRRIEA